MDNAERDVYAMLDHAIEEARAQAHEWIRSGCFELSFEVAIKNDACPTIKYSCFKPSIPEVE